MPTKHTQTTDISETFLVGITFDVDDEIWTVASGVSVASAQAAGVRSDKDLSKLVNKGEISSGGNAYNSAGVVFNGTGQILDNRGSVTATRAAVFCELNSDDIEINNSGTIHGGTLGIHISSQNDGGAIVNSGLIEGEFNAIYVYSDTGLTTRIDNAAGGVIRSLGSDPAITIEIGRLSLRNDGTIIGDIDCNDISSNDLIINTGRINGEVFLGGGDDTFHGTGGTSGPIHGENGSDRLIGGAGADKFFGGNGVDTISGGGGKDQFFFDALAYADIITDFKPNIDKMVLDDDLFDTVGPPGQLAPSRFHIGAAAHDPSDRIIYNPDTGFLICDADGSRNTAFIVRLALLPKHLDLDSGDFLVVA